LVQGYSNSFRQANLSVNQNVFNQVDQHLCVCIALERVAAFG
jgi:hypothetical protein